MENHDKRKRIRRCLGFTDNDWNSDFIKTFDINSIPRFILIDSSGKVVKADATKPSSAELQIHLDALLN